MLQTCDQKLTHVFVMGLSVVINNLLFTDKKAYIKDKDKTQVSSFKMENLIKP